VNCNDIENRISGYLDGELSDREMKQFEEHIASCPKCAGLISEMESLDNILHEMEEPLPDEAYWGSFDARLSEKIDKASTPRPWWSIFTRFNRTQWALAAIAIMFIIAFPLIWEIIFSHKTAPMTKQGVKISTPTKETKTTDLRIKESMKHGEDIVTGEFEKKAVEESEPAPPDKFAMKEPESKVPVNEDGGADAEKPPGGLMETSVPGKPFAHSEYNVKALPGKAPAKKPADNAPPAGRVSGDEAKPPTIDNVAGSAPPKPAKAKPMKRETSKSRDRTTGHHGAGDKPVVKYGGKGRVPPPESAKIGGAHRRVMKPIPAAPAALPPPKLAVKSAPPASSTKIDGAGRTRGGAVTADTNKKDECGMPVSESLDDFTKREEIRRESVDVNKYLATSEVMLIKILSMPETKTGLALIRKELTRANYVENLNNDARKFKKDPLLRKHIRAMQGITNEVMNISPGEIKNLKKKVIDSGLIDQTKEIGK